MLINKSNIYSFNYKVDFLNPLSLFLGLFHEIAVATIDDFDYRELFTPDFIISIGLDVDSDFTYEDLSYYVIEYYNKEIFNIINLDETNILYVYKNSKILLTYVRPEGDSENSKKAVINLIKKANIFSLLLSKVRSFKLKNNLSKLGNIKFSDELYSKVFNIENKAEISSPIIEFSTLNSNLIEEDFIDENDTHINKARVLEKFNVEISNPDQITIVKDKAKSTKKVIGIKYNNLLLPFETSIEQFVKQDELINYYWLSLKIIYQEKVTRKSYTSNDLLKSFKDELRNLEFIHLMSHLENNHSLKKTFSIQDQHKKYFELATKIDRLKEIEQFKFYITNVEDATALGIYVDPKFGSSYNLLHWIKNESRAKKLNHYRSINPIPLAVEEVQVLKPELAFYFIESFFEDFFEYTLINTRKEYIRNFKLYSETKIIGEFDFLVKSKNKLIFIEVKTKLTDFYIDKFINTCSELLEHIGHWPANLKIEFYLFSAFSDDSCLTKEFFINRTKKKPNYNSQRLGLKSVPYYFTIPIFKHPKFELTCIAEPEFKKLKKLVNNLL
ncbi:hypothetical protein ACAW74_06415 [Fibrella sp. WM1]|uniref:hypothetical protein n=1 Tax=Fibrella musci TaxID=3242485 RepID=UPI0035220F1B